MQQLNLGAMHEPTFEDALSVYLSASIPEHGLQHIVSHANFLQLERYIATDKPYSHDLDRAQPDYFMVSFERNESFVGRETALMTSRITSFL